MGANKSANLFAPTKSLTYFVSMNAFEPQMLIPRRMSATNARVVWVRLLREVADTGLPLEITRRQKPSVLLVRAADFESGLGRSHPWSDLRARISPGSFHPNGLQPGVTHRWTHASSTWIRDHFRSVLEAVDTDGQPLLITRRGHCGLMLLARRVFEAHWNPSITVRDSRSEETIGSNLATDPRIRLCKAGARARATADFRSQLSP
jgi:PHD/YefM family antitoxin component YafN of YafNO toxin-antitoxin module